MPLDGDDFKMIDKGFLDIFEELSVISATLTVISATLKHLTIVLEGVGDQIYEARKYVSWVKEQSE